MSALPPKADIHRQIRHVRFVPQADYLPLTAFFAPVIGPEIPPFVPRGWERNDAATLWEFKIASDAMPLDA